VFKDVADIIKPQAFVAEFSDTFVQALETDTGKVSNTRLLRLNGISVEERKNIEVSFKKEIAAWNPTKDDLTKYVKTLNSSKKVAENHFKVTKSSAKQLADNRKMINQFLSFTHGIDSLRVNKSWEVSLTPKMEESLKKAAKSKSSDGLRVVKNVFHGTYRQAGSIILARGFKISGTQVTARSMGDVLYIAANADKSAQYMRAGGAFSSGTKVTGMIFMGDCIVKGTPARSIRGKGGDYSWTKTGAFKTEEIGLVNPNAQFIIRKAMIVTMERKGYSPPRAAARRVGGPRRVPAASANPAAVKGIAHFEAPIAMSAYLASNPQMLMPQATPTKKATVKKEDTAKKTTAKKTDANKKAGAKVPKAAAGKKVKKS
jgi:hypothetical protein